MDVSKWVIRTVIALLVALLVFLFFAAPSADARVVDDQVPVEFALRAEPASLSTAKGGLCWRSGFSRQVVNQVGNTAYHPAMEVMWCTNRAGTKVVSIPTYLCSNRGGFYTFLGCSKSRGGLGYRAVSIHVAWSYEFGCCGVYIRRSPSLEGRISAGGRFSGTFYF